MSQREAMRDIARYEVFELVDLVAAADDDGQALRATSHPASAINLMSPAALAALIQAQREFAAATDRAAARPAWHAARDAATEDLTTHLLTLPHFTDRRTPGQEPIAESIGAAREPRDDPCAGEDAAR